MYVTLQKWRSEELIGVNTDMVLTLESTSYSPPACRVNLTDRNSVLVDGSMGQVLNQMNGFSNKDGLVEFKKRRTRGPNKRKASRNE